MKAIHENADAVAELGCIVCLLSGYPETPCEIHHLRCDAGMAQRSQRIIGLCPIHHRLGWQKIPSFHNHRKAFIEKYGDEDHLHQWVEKLLNENER